MLSHDFPVYGRKQNATTERPAANGWRTGDQRLAKRRRPGGATRGTRGEARGGAMAIARLPIWKPRAGGASKKSQRRPATGHRGQLASRKAGHINDFT